MKIEIKGPIVSDSDQVIYDWFGIPATSPGKVNRLIDQAIRNNDNELLVLINSGGGSVFSASEIYTALKSFNGNVKIRIVGIAASAASVIASSGYCEITPTGQLMIHNASTSAWGDYREMDYTSDFLQKVNKTIINAYKMKTNKTEDELKEMMNKTTWMTAQEAKEMGFVDAIMFEDELDAAATVGNERTELINGLLPREVIDKMRTQLANEPERNILNTVQENKENINNFIQNTGGVINKMDLQTLQNDYPELYKQVKNIGFNEGVKAENERIKAIEDMAPAGHDKMVYNAKFTEPITAEKLAVQMIKAQKEAGKSYIQAAQEDAQALNNVRPTSAPETDNVTDEEKAAQALLNMWGGK